MYQVPCARHDRERRRKHQTRVGGIVRHDGQVTKRSAGSDRGLPGEELSTAAEASGRRRSWTDECVFQRMERPNTRFRPHDPEPGPGGTIWWTGMFANVLGTAGPNE